MKDYKIYHTVSTSFSSKDVLNWLKQSGREPYNDPDYEPNTQEVADYAYSLFKRGDYEYEGSNVYDVS